jgi:hypothetical protein
VTLFEIGVLIGLGAIVWLLVELNRGLSKITQNQALVAEWVRRTAQNIEDIRNRVLRD